MHPPASSRSRIFTALLSVGMAGLIFGVIYFFRPLPVRGWPKLSWALVCLPGGLILGWACAASLRQAAQLRLPRRLVITMAGGAVLMAGATAALPGAQHPAVYPNPFSGTRLEVTARQGDAVLQNLFINARRVDWPSECSLSGSYEPLAESALRLAGGAQPGKISCVLYPPQPGSQARVVFQGGGTPPGVEIWVDGRSMPAAGSLALPVTRGILLARGVEFAGYLAGIAWLMALVLTAVCTQRRPGRVIRVGIFLAFALAVILANRSAYAFINNIESKDAGVFLYAGQAILKGQVPYRDVWDHKPPLVFFLNALGLALGHGSAWGVWALEVALLIASGVLLFGVIRRHYGWLAGLAGSLLWLLGLSVLFRVDETNVPEAWGLFFQAALLGLIDRQVDDDSPQGWGLFAAGMLTGLCFLLKQVLVGIGLALLLVMVVNTARSRKWSVLVRQMGLLGLGAGITLGAAVVYFWANHALADAWEAAFRYNFIYVHVPLTQVVKALLAGLAGPLWPAEVPAYLGWLLAVWGTLKRGNSRLALVYRVGLIAFPLEIAFEALSGRGYHYYALAGLYGVALFGGLLASALFEQLRAALSAKGRSAWTLPAVFGLVYLCLMTVLLGEALPVSLTFSPARSTHVLTLDYLKAHAAAHQPVLMWGNEAALNFYSGQPAPGRFVYQYPLVTCGYLDAQKAAEYTRSLANQPPQYIVDTFDPLMPPLDETRLADWASRQGCPGLVQLQPVLDFIHSRYAYVDSVGRWKLYALQAK